MLFYFLMVKGFSDNNLNNEPEIKESKREKNCLLYTSDAADEV